MTDDSAVSSLLCCAAMCSSNLPSRLCSDVTEPVSMQKRDRKGIESKTKSIKHRMTVYVSVHIET